MKCHVLFIILKKAATFECRLLQKNRWCFKGYFLFIYLFFSIFFSIYHNNRDLGVTKSVQNGDPSCKRAP